MIAAMLGIYQTNSDDNVFYIFFFFFDDMRWTDEYVFILIQPKINIGAMFLMNMDAKEYTISNYLYQMIKVLIGFSVYLFLWYECRSSTLDYDSLSYLCHDG